MEAGLYTIYDRVADESSPPFVARTDGLAIRLFLQAMANNPNPKDDYLLYHVGYWDSFNSNSLVKAATPRQIIISPNEGVEV